MEPVRLNADNFDKEVIEAKEPVLVDFFATWCGPCKMLSPLLDQIAEETEGVKVGKVDVDQEEDLVSRFGIEAMPTILAFKDGEVVGKQVGFAPKDKLLAMVGK
jgi:thioredoxin 1